MLPSSVQVCFFYVMLGRVAKGSQVAGTNSPGYFVSL